MKYYETHYEEYTTSVDRYNAHPELKELNKKMSDRISQFGNLIIYGPSGSGKYSQILRMIKKYSPSELKYEKKMTLQTEKQTYMYRISDIHYEIDMALLGCNSKIIWHEVFSQIVDIVSMKNDKNGIIVCKNFHSIHTELLEIFYSYMQQYNHPQLNIQIKFILVTEHLSFIPNSVINNCRVVSIGKPTADNFVDIVSSCERRPLYQLANRIDTPSIINSAQSYYDRISNLKTRKTPDMDKIKSCMENVDVSGILNIKEMQSFSIIKNGDFPGDVFNTICDNIIEEIMNPNNLVITDFRDTLYDILVYNLDAADCLCYILSYFIKTGSISKNDISDILKKTHSFLKHYNNNYRPIYHLESIFFYILNKIHHYEL
jgi:hypothetical protein